MSTTSPRLEQLLQFLTESPEDSFLLFAVAKEYEGLNDLPTALTYYQKIKSNEPEYVGTYYHLGKLYEQLEQPAKAFAIYKEGIEVTKKVGDHHALSELAGAKMSLGDDEDFE